MQGSSSYRAVFFLHSCFDVDQTRKAHPAHFCVVQRCRARAAGDAPGLRVPARGWGRGSCRQISSCPSAGSPPSPGRPALGALHRPAVPRREPSIARPSRAGSPPSPGRPAPGALHRLAVPHREPSIARPSRAGSPHSAGIRDAKPQAFCSGVWCAERCWDWRGPQGLWVLCPGAGPSRAAGAPRERSPRAPLCPHPWLRVCASPCGKDLELMLLSPPPHPRREQLRWDVFPGWARALRGRGGRCDVVGRFEWKMPPVAGGS